MFKLKPHHIIDIVRDYGIGNSFAPHSYGHAYHTLAKQLIEHTNTEVQLVVTSDDICSPCKHLGQDKQCDDILEDHPYSTSKQIYNAYLDKKILEFLGLPVEIVIPVTQFLELVNEHSDLFDQLYPYPRNVVEQRKTAFQQGLMKLHIL